MLALSATILLSLMSGVHEKALNPRQGSAEDISRDGRAHCFPRASGPVPERKGQVNGATSFGEALRKLARQTLKKKLDDPKYPVDPCMAAALHQASAPLAHYFPSRRSLLAVRNVV